VNQEKYRAEYEENLRWIARYRRTIERSPRDAHQVTQDIRNLEARNVKIMGLLGQ
jgi:DNA-directed RNA polymerase specialized sigma24 family protein